MGDDDATPLPSRVPMSCLMALAVLPWTILMALKKLRFK
jgi:hypothetical protein